MRKLAFAFLIVGTLLMVGGVAQAGGSSGGSDPLVPAPTTSASTTVVEHHPVTICHRTNSVTNPYVIITVDDDAVDGIADQGADDHFGVHLGPIFDPANPPPPPHNGDQWGDIIPPTADDGFPLPHSGLNWPAGAAILAAGCTFPATTTPPTETTTPPVTTTTPPATTTTPATHTTTPPATTPPATVSPSTSSAPPPKHSNQGPGAGPTEKLAFTGIEDVVPLGAAAIAFLTAGSGLLWAGNRRRQRFETPPRPDLP